MKRRNLNILILIFLVIVVLSWLFIPNEFTENYEWIIYILAVPLGFFSLMVFSKLPFEKSLRAIICITLGVFITLLLSKDLLSILFISKILSVLLGSVITFLVSRFIK